MNNFLKLSISRLRAPAIAVAHFGTRRPAPPASSQGQQPQQVGISALLADQFAMERLTNEMKRIADAGEDIAKALNRASDMMDISRAIERLKSD